MKFGRFYTLFIILLFAAFAVVFNTFPRSVYSPLEKRELAQFPTFTWALAVRRLHPRCFGLV